MRPFVLVCSSVCVRRCTVTHCIGDSVGLRYCSSSGSVAYIRTYVFARFSLVGTVLLLSIMRMQIHLDGVHSGYRFLLPVFASYLPMVHRCCLRLLALLSWSIVPSLLCTLPFVLAFVVV